MTTIHQDTRFQTRIRLMICALALVAACVLAAEQAQAYCVYNHTDKTIAVIQTGGASTFGGMSAWIEPGDKACCNWQNKDCNKKGKKTSTLHFLVQFIGGAYSCNNPTICKDKAVKAGGWLSVTGKYPDDGKCKAKY